MFRVYFQGTETRIDPLQGGNQSSQLGEQSGKSHYKAVIVTPEQSLQNPNGAARVGTILTLVIAATRPAHL